MPTYRVAANSFAIQMTGGYSTGPALNTAGFVGTNGAQALLARAQKQAVIQGDLELGPLSILNPDLLVPVTFVDTPLVVTLLEDYQVQVAGGVIDPINQVRLERRYSNWPHVQGVDARHGVYCELTVHEDKQEAEFTAAFPRGASKAFIGPVFALCARRVIAELATRQPGANVSTWRVFGTFLHGQDESQIPDGGQSICLAWQAYFATFGLTVTAFLPPGSSIWVAEMLLVDLASHGVV